VHDVFARLVDTLHDPRLSAIEKQERVKVAVAGMEHIYDKEPMPLSDLVHCAEHPGKR
jgi:hypothetical protein